MKHILLFCTLSLCICGSIYAQTPSILWRFNTHDESFGNGAVADLVGDGRLEIAFSCYWGDSMIYVLHADDGSLVWKQNMGGCNDAAPIIYDVDNDGHPEVILGSSCNPVLTCFNGATGAIKWQTPFGGTDSPPAIADIDGDSIPEILVGDFEGYLNCFNARTGQLKWQVLVDDSGAIEASPALVDVNGDGHPDIIVCTWSYGGNGDSTAVYAYDGLTHALLWKNPIPTDVIYHGAAFGDVIENGKPQFAVSSYDGNVYLLSGDSGRLVWKYSTPGLAYIPDPVTIGDLDNDGHLDLVYINGNGEVDALDRFGQLKWSYILDLYESSFRGAVLADVNNDDTLDVIFATTEGKLCALNGSQGNFLWNIDLRSDYGDSLFELEHGPLVSSFRGDDTLDIFVVGGYANSDSILGDFGRAYAIKLGKGKGPDWTMFQHDYIRSNCVCSQNYSTGISPLSNDPFSVADYPNPFSKNITFNIDLTQRTKLSMIVYDERGIAVRTFADSDISQGMHTYIWDGNNDEGSPLTDGIYFCHITAGHSATVRKIVLIR